MYRSIRVIHADDHKIVRDAISEVLFWQTNNMVTVAQAASYDELYRVLADVPAEVLLLDGLIDGGSIDENLPVIRTLYPHLKIILFWVGADTNSLTKWIHLLDGQLTIGYMDFESLIRAIETVIRGEKYFTLPVPPMQTDDHHNP